MLKAPLKRFYKQAAIADTPDGHAVTLDGKPVKTPAGKPLAVPSRPLADAIAAEWNAQGERIDPASMPMTQLASTALDRVAGERAAILAGLMRYGCTDLLCYPAETPADLAARQEAGWQPILDWAARTLGAPLCATRGILAVEQPPDSLAALEARIAGYGLWALTALQAATAASGSLLLGMALAEGRLSGAEVWTLSQIDETYQIEQWGEDFEAAERRARLEAEIMAAERLLALCAPTQSAT